MALRSFFEAHSRPREICHLDSLADRIEILAPHVDAVALDPTSCVDLWCVVDDDDDSWRPYDLKRDSGHWYLDEQLKGEQHES